LSEFSIDEQLYELHHSPEWESGIACRVLIRYPIFQITLRAMKAGTCIPTTITQGESACIFWVGTSHACGWQVRPAAKAKMLVLDRTITHEAEPTEESAFLLTLAYAEKG
jgi:hypothetical protein